MAPALGFFNNMDYKDAPCHNVQALFSISSSMKSQILTVIEKVELVSGVYKIVFRLSEPVTFFPGQYVVLQIDPKTFRSYSIVALDDKTLTLLIDTRVGGIASKFFEASKEGTELNLIGVPLGRFAVQNTEKSKIFVATGTGLAPFVPMIKTILQKNPDAEVKLYFGARHEKDDYCEHFFEDFSRDKHPNFQIIHCISQPEDNLPESSIEGRVTKVVPEKEQDCSEPEFYLCGNPKMVDDIQEVLRQHGADENLFTEKYG